MSEPLYQACPHCTSREVVPVCDCVVIRAVRVGVTMAQLERMARADEILNAPCVMMFDPAREPTENERHLFNLLSWREQENRDLKADVLALQKQITGLCDRIAAQAELLAKRAENSQRGKEPT